MITKAAASMQHMQNNWNLSNQQFPRTVSLNAGPSTVGDPLIELAKQAMSSGDDSNTSCVRRSASIDLQFQLQEYIVQS